MEYSKPLEVQGCLIVLGRLRKLNVGGGVGVIFAQERGGYKGCSAVRPEP